MEPKLIFPIFWNGQIHVHFELARCDFGDYYYYPGFAGFQRSLRLVDAACVSTYNIQVTPKRTPADCKRLHNHSTEVAEIFVGGLLRACHEIPTRHTMKYSLSRSESEFEQVTARVQVDSHVKDQS